MNATQCNARAARCASKAKTAPTQSIASEFLNLAAQWRLMAAGAITLNPFASLVEPEEILPAFPGARPAIAN
jgi:hypothetical protein